MSSKDLLTKFNELMKRFKNEFDEIIEAERTMMRAEVEAFNEEKKRMQASAVRDDDILHLNVGGQKFTTKRSTLCQVEGSLFAKMFSGRWEDSLERDHDGAVFFDFNPQFVAIILDYLRAKRISTLENPNKIPKIPEDQVRNFNILVKYLCLSDEIFPTEIVFDEKFNLHGPGVTLEEDGKVAVHDGNSGHEYVLGENIHRQKSVDMKLKLESLLDNFWVFIGILEGDFQPPNKFSCDCPGSNGWSLGSSGAQGMRKEGTFTKDSTLVNVTKEGDTMKLILDCDADKLSLHLSTGL
ncbi:uncharacterized protein LOC114533497 [Dendronephthya gigantea]|uniref:uncharacterized protein LOC114533497 n=1 Tax=Dendronephthya gigantea TaxID=151771 RepID=UPI00106C2310|nr:uncharacterized protein LOC114533497 [Dendronephthya gigantea]